jgi:RnfABCDGE-type electron transport complex B subunit
MSGIIIAAVVVSCTGLLLGLFLGVMGKKFYVEVDQKEIDVRAELPGNNCGGCGYAGCDALAKAIAAGEAPANACPVGGAPVASKIGAIMGEEVGESVRMTAFVKCAGDCDKAKENYVYSGAMDCTAMNVVPNGGSKACTYGCMGYGSCVKACPFDAIHIVDRNSKIIYPDNTGRKAASIMEEKLNVGKWNEMYDDIANKFFDLQIDMLQTRKKHKGR